MLKLIRHDTPVDVSCVWPFGFSSGRLRNFTRVSSYTAAPGSGSGSHIDVANLRVRLATIPVKG